MGPPTESRPTLILASTSRYRRELLARLRVDFEAHAPGVDETALAGEAPAALAVRLALAKAQAVARAHPNAVVIGSDQVADLAGDAIGKPGTHERAVAQLKRMRGHSVIFHTAVAVVHAATGFVGTALVPVTVRYRDLTDAQIEHYLRPTSPTTAPGVPSARRWGSRCSKASVQTIRPRWSACH